ncbi:MAG: PTS sugar transporter subunit IIB [Mycoplasmatales bacterium]|nr:PTS sugar transporter subunit IIB [Mycoplasmatales bacterium]
MKIVAACGNGMGTSMIIKLKVEKIVKNLGLENVSVEALSAGQAKGRVVNSDIIICSTHLVDQFDSSQRAKIVGVRNLMDDKEIESALKEVI